MKKVILIQHPLVQHNLAILRDQRTEPQEFRRVLGEMAALMVYESTRSFATRRISMRTPLARTQGAALKREVILVPVLRAGLGMLPPILQLIPHARVGFIGVKRDEETLQPGVYHRSLPPSLKNFETILIDPMLATGGSALAALDLLAERGAQRIRLVCLVAAPEGVLALRKGYPGLPIYTAALDQRLNEQGYIVPGLGDAGDRLFGV